MRRPQGPVLTLLAGVALAVVIYILDVHAYDVAHASTTPSNPYGGGTVENTPTAIAPGSSTGPSGTPTTTGPSATPPPSATPAVPAGTYAGHTDGSTSSIAIVIRKDGKAVAYLCSGKIESWLQGSVQGTALTMTGTNKGSLHATLSGSALKGTTSAAGKSFAFTISAVHAPSGLWRAAATIRGAKVLAGWIVLPNGDQVGMVNNGGKETTAPPLQSTHKAPIDGGTLTASQVDGISGYGF